MKHRDKNWLRILGLLLVVVVLTMLPNGVVQASDCWDCQGHNLPNPNGGSYGYFYFCLWTGGTGWEQCYEDPTGQGPCVLFWRGCSWDK